MIDSASAEKSFLIARAATDRAACDRWIKTQGVNMNDAVAVDAAKSLWHSLPLLLSDELQQMSDIALAQAKGPPVTSSTKFVATIWPGGATDTADGHTFNNTFTDFIALLETRATELAPKRSGWVVTPTTTLDGRRTNASTVAMHALNLDCDARGTWDRLLAALAERGFAFIAYQSGGWTPTSPKWHLLLPLAQPFDVSTPDKQTLWKMAYGSARVVFGALGGLLGEGFDPTVETPSIPIFITEKRETNDPPRQVVFNYGAALDLVSLIVALPTPDAEVRGIAPALQIEKLTLDAEKLESVITTLVRPMSKIYSGRRYLRLSLPGALLDRGVLPDDMLFIVDEVSRRAPGDPSYTPQEVAERHREQIHAAHTTIAKWEKGEPYYRIGTIVESWPQVATAIDEALPSRRMLLALEASRATTLRGGTIPPAQSARVGEARPGVDLGGLRKDIASLRRKKIQSNNPEHLIHGLLLERLHNGLPLTSISDVTGLDRDTALRKTMGLLAFQFPLNTPTEAVAELIRESVHATLPDGEKLDDWMQMAEVSYLQALGTRLEKRLEMEAQTKAQFERATAGMPEHVREFLRPKAI